MHRLQFSSLLKRLKSEQMLISSNHKLIERKISKTIRLNKLLLMSLMMNIKKLSQRLSKEEPMLDALRRVVPSALALVTENLMNVERLQIRASSKVKPVKKRTQWIVIQEQDVAESSKREVKAVETGVETIERSLRIKILK